MNHNSWERQVIISDWHVLLANNTMQLRRRQILLVCYAAFSAGYGALQLNRAYDKEVNAKQLWSPIDIFCCCRTIARWSPARPAAEASSDTPRSGCYQSVPASP